MMCLFVFYVLMANSILTSFTFTFSFSFSFV